MVLSAIIINSYCFLPITPLLKQIHLQQNSHSFIHVTELHFQFSHPFLLFHLATSFPTMPVLETLGGALFGAVLQMLFDKLDSNQILDYFRGKKLDEKLLKNLKRKLVSINAVVDDAELKQFRNAYVKAWLDEVRDVLLDTEDLLDEIDYEFSKTQSQLQYQTSSNKVRILESKLKEVLEDLESLLNQKDDLGLKNVGGVRSEFGNKVLEKRNESSSLVAEEVIYGRDEDKQIILNWLTSDTNNHNQLSILSIVGMAGWVRPHLLNMYTTTQ